MKKLISMFVLLTLVTVSCYAGIKNPTREEWEQIKAKILAHGVCSTQKVIHTNEDVCMCITNKYPPTGNEVTQIYTEIKAHGKCASQESNKNLRVCMIQDGKYAGKYVGYLSGICKDVKVMRETNTILDAMMRTVNGRDNVKKNKDL